MQQNNKSSNSSSSNNSSSNFNVDYLNNFFNKNSSNAIVKNNVNAMANLATALGSPQPLQFMNNEATSAQLVQQSRDFFNVQTPVAVNQRGDMVTTDMYQTTLHFEYYHSDMVAFAQSSQQKFGISYMGFGFGLDSSDASLHKAGSNGAKKCVINKMSKVTKQFTRDNNNQPMVVCSETAQYSIDQKELTSQEFQLLEAFFTKKA